MPDLGLSEYSIRKDFFPSCPFSSCLGSCSPSDIKKHPPNREYPLTSTTATADGMARNASMIASLDRSVPLIADADIGFGGPVMVARSARPPLPLHLSSSD